MSDLSERILERRIAAGDLGAVKTLQHSLCRRGDHRWGRWYPALGTCLFCGISQQDYEAARRTEKLWRKKAAQAILCADNNHEWVPGEKLPEDCGCPEIPHHCHLRECEGCGIPEELGNE